MGLDKQIRQAKTLIFQHYEMLKHDITQLEQTQIDQEARLRELERTNTNIATGTYTPDKISHKFEIDLLNRFLEVSYPYVFYLRSEMLLFDSIELLNDRIGNGIDLYFEYKTPVDGIRSIMVGCNCSGCAEEA